MKNRFYAFVDVIGNRIFHRYVDEQGKPQNEVIKDHPFELFIKSNKGDAVGLYGDQLGRIQFDSVESTREFIKENSNSKRVHGQTSLAHQFIASMYPQTPELDLDCVTILNYDIEVEHEDGFPDPSKAEREVLSITAKVFGGKAVTFGTKDYSGPHNYVQCKNEKELLLKFVGFWHTTNPHFITGWNIDTFDTPYIINRIKVVFGDTAGKSIISKLGPFGKELPGDYGIQTQTINPQRGDQGYKIVGVNNYDLLNLYQKFSLKKQESYRLDAIAEDEIGENKVSLEPWGNNLMRLYNEDYETFVDYNVKDVVLVERLDNKLQLIRLACTITLMTRSRYQEAFGTVKVWDNFIYNMLLEQNIQIPPEQFASDAGEIVGGFVKAPLVGRQDWVVSLDLTSLYPSIIRMYNMSPETIRVNANNGMAFYERHFNFKTLEETAEWRDAGLSIAANGSCYDQSKEGVLAAAMTYVFNTRKKYKDMMLDVKREKEKLLASKSEDDTEVKTLSNQIAMLDGMQHAMKILANSGYGACANQAFRYFDNNIAEGITITGQFTIQWIIRSTNEWLNQKFGTTDTDYVVAADTDSMYLRLGAFIKKLEDSIGSKIETSKAIDVLDAFIKREIEPNINKWFTEMAKYNGCRVNLMDMKREAIADAAIFRGRKNYIIQVWDNEGVRYAKPVLKQVGIESVKSSTPRIIRDELEKHLLICINGSPKELQNSVAEFKKRYYNLPLNQIALPRGVSNIEKWMTGDGSYKKGTPIHVRAAILYNKLIREKGLHHIEPLKSGSKLRYAFLSTPNPIHSNVIGFVDDLPEEFGLNQYIDRASPWEKTFIGPLKSFADLIDWDVVKVNRLDDMFE